MKADPKLSEQLRREFQSWRDGKLHNHEKIPQELLTKAKEYAPQFGSFKARKVTRLISNYFEDD
jgi:hypothetical protein